MTNTKSIQALFHLSQLISNEQYIVQYAKNKVLVEAFFEPSTRTSLSFECAMKKLGGYVIQLNPKISSKHKGETDIDTIKTLSNYGDALVLRHPNSSLINQLEKTLNIPIINAGNGDQFHPSQALLDLYTTYKKFGMDFVNKHFLFVGDIKHSRTIHSFIHLLHLYPNTKIYLHPYLNCEPSEFYIEEIATKHNQDKKHIIVSYEQLNYKNYDIIYLTRNQKERQNQIVTKDKINSCFPCIKINNIQYNNVEQTIPFVFNQENAKQMKKDAIILHPFPRNEELHPSVDIMPQAYYFQQSKYGVELRMAILETLFKEQSNHTSIIIKTYKYFHKLREVIFFTCNILNLKTLVYHMGIYHWITILLMYYFYDNIF